MDQHSKQGEGERKQVETAAESHKLQGHNCCSGHGSCGGHGHHHAPAAVKDPVCGMTVDPNAGSSRLIPTIISLALTKRLPRIPPLAPNTPAPCIPKLSGTLPAIAPSAAWHWSP